MNTTEPFSLIEYQDARTFLDVMQADLEQTESLNGLMLGVCLQLVADSKSYGSMPFLATIQRSNDLQLAAVMSRFSFRAT